MKFNYSVYRPNHLVRDTFREPSSYYRASDVHATPLTTVGALQETANGAVKHIPVRIEEASQPIKKPVFPKNFSIAKLMAARKRPSRKQLMLEPVAPQVWPYLSTSAMTSQTEVRHPGSRPYTSVNSSRPAIKTFRDHSIESVIAIGRAIVAWYLGVREWLSELWLNIRGTPKHYSLREGSATATVSSATIRAALLGFGLFVAVMFTFLHHSVAPGTTTSPGAGSAGPQSETLGSEGPNAASNTANHGSNTKDQNPRQSTASSAGPSAASAGNTSGSPSGATSVPSGSSGTGSTGASSAGNVYSSAGSVVGGYGGGSSPSAPAVSSGSTIQPSGSGAVMPSPTPSPQPVSVPGVTSPLPVTVPGQSVNVSGKPVVSTSPVTLTLN